MQFKILYILLFSLCIFAGLSACGLSTGNNHDGDRTSPEISQVRSNVLSDTDNTYPTGRVIRIDVILTSLETDIVSGTIRIKSQSQNYDSGIQSLSRGSFFFFWDTTGLNPASDYQVEVVLTDSSGNTSTDNSLIITLAPNPPAINKLVSNLDISVPAKGLPVNIVRTYLLDSTFDGPFGYGCTHTYRMRVVEYPTRLIASLQIVDGVTQLFNADGTASYFKPNGDGTYESPKGDYRTLSKAADGTYQLHSKFGNIFNFDKYGRLVSIKDRNSNTQTVAYDANGLVDTVTDSSGRVTTFTYNTNKKITSITDPAGRSTNYTYDGDGNLVAFEDIGGFTTQYSYDEQHNLTSITDPTGKTVQFTVDADDRLASVSGDGGANKITFEYATPSADKMTITDALNKQTIITYDTYGLVTKIQDPLNRVTTQTYDANLNLVSIVDAKSNETTFTYDDLGNVTKATDANKNTINLTYDAAFNQVASLTEAKGNTARFRYDSKGNLVSRTYPDNSSESFSYDVNGNLTGKTDRKGQTINYSYNAIGQLTKKAFPDGSSDSFEYNDFGNLTKATDDKGTISFDYDAAGRLTAVTYPGGEQVAYAYDNANRRSQLVYPDGTVLDYDYDSVGRLTQIGSGGSMIAAYSYDDASRIIRRDLQNGTYTTYDYDESGQLTGLFNRKSSNAIISSFEYTYDESGNRETMKTLDGITTYVYDNINQLTEVIYPNSATTSYNLDPSGNRSSVVDNGNIINYSTNELNQYASVGGDSYQYDANGNLAQKTTSEGVTTYRYDFEDRLIQVVTPTETVAYTYDPFGRRTSKTISADTTNYIFDKYEVIEEKDQDDNQLANYIYGLRTDEVIVMKRNGNNYYYNHDGLENVANITDALENTLETYKYNAYGYPFNISTIGNTFQFNSHEYEAETELYYYRARYYDPKIGRFLSPDPAGFLSGDINLYSYVFNSPINYNDTFGLKSTDPGVIDPNKNGWEDYWTKGKYRSKPYYRFIEDLDKPYLPWFLDPKEWKNGKPPGPWWKNIWKSIWEGLNKVSGPNDKGWPDQSDLKKPNPAGDGGNDISQSCIDNPATCSCEEQPQLCVTDPSYVSVSRRIPFKDTLSKTPANKNGLHAKITVPYEDSMVRGDVPIFGLAYGKGFTGFRVEFGEGRNPTQWTTIASSAEPIAENVTAKDLDDSTNITIHGNLATWDTGLKNYVYLPSHPKDHPVNLKGTYTIRLVVSGADGHTVEDRVTVDVGYVIPNAWGGIVNSKDNMVSLTVPEQALMDSFRLFAIQKTDIFPKGKAQAPSDGMRLIGSVYEMREAGEKLIKPAQLCFSIPESAVQGDEVKQLSIAAYYPVEKRWKRLPSTRREDGNTVMADLQQLQSHYALVASDNPEETALLQTDTQTAPNFTKVSENSGLYFIDNTFESDLGEWSNRDGDVGAEVALDNTVTFDQSNALKITNTNAGGNFAVNITASEFDAAEYPVIQFDYRIPADVKTDFLVKVSGRWYDIGFTDDPKELAGNRVNIAHIGDITDVRTDDQWHTAQFNLLNLLRTKTANTKIESFIMADWNVGGYMKLQFGGNRQGATYYIDNFSISREATSGRRAKTSTLLIDDFNKKKEKNALGGTTRTFVDSKGGMIKTAFSSQDAHDKGHALALSYDLSDRGHYAGYVSNLQTLDLRGFQTLSFRLKTAESLQNVLLGLKDSSGTERKVSAAPYLDNDSNWQQITIPLVAFSNELDWSRIVNLSLSIVKDLHSKGIILVDDLAFHKDIHAFSVDDFEQSDNANLLGGEQTTFTRGAAAINGRYTKGSPNGIYSLSYGGNIGIHSVYASDMKSYAGWTTDLRGVDCSDCKSLSFKLRGAEGGENFTLYLDDGNFRWGFPISQYSEVTTNWQTIHVPLNDFSEYGLDLTHLSKLQVVFEGQKMSGTVYLDDIVFGATETQTTTRHRAQ